MWGSAEMGAAELPLWLAVPGHLDRHPEMCPREMEILKEIGFLPSGWGLGKEGRSRNDRNLVMGGFRS